jgi:hypothetical protein
METASFLANRFDRIQPHRTLRGEPARTDCDNQDEGAGRQIRGRISRSDAIKQA